VYFYTNLLVTLDDVEAWSAGGSVDDVSDHPAARSVNDVSTTSAFISPATRAVSHPHARTDRSHGTLVSRRCSHRVGLQRQSTQSTRVQLPATGVGRCCRQ